MDEVTKAEHAYRRADQARDKALGELHAAIAAYLLEHPGRGAQAALVRKTGYTRERIRQIARAAGIEATA